VAGLAALILLLGFTGGIANAMSRGRAPDCHCFGQVHSAPAGRGTLARNLALAVPATLVAVEGPGPSVSAWVADRTGVELAAIAAVAVFGPLVAAVVHVWRENRGLRRRLAAAQAEIAGLPPGLPVSAVAPDFALPSATGEVISLGALRARGRPVALVFADPGCGGCEPLLAAVGRWQATLADRLTIAVVSTGSPAENQVAARDADHVLLQEDFEVAHAYGAWATPATVIVAPNGRVASALVSGPYQAESLIRVTLRQDIGVPAPAPIVAGQRVA
jgi:peroxiredoxin